MDTPKISSSFIDKYEEYLPEFVYGGIDGSITTFAVVAGATGAHLSVDIVIILGLGNLVADGFSMSVGGYLSSKSEIDAFNKNLQKEHQEIENTPESERKEVEMAFVEMGFDGQVLRDATETICADKDRWANFMMHHELGMIKPSKSPFAVGLATFTSFAAMGAIPLILYIIHWIHPLGINLFTWASSLTLVSFIFIGYFKGVINQRAIGRSILETVGLGLAAAALAYFTGEFLENLLR